VKGTKIAVSMTVIQITLHTQANWTPPTPSSQSPQDRIVEIH